MKKSLYTAMTLISVISTFGMMNHQIIHAEESIKYSDIDGHWAKNDIKWASDTGIVHGYEDGTFLPNNEVTQAEFLTMLVNMFVTKDKVSKELFDKTKTSESVWDAKVYQIAKDLNWNLGERYAPVSRGRVALIIENSQGLNCDVYESVQALLMDNISSGKTSATIDGYRMGDTLTRAEAVKFLENAYSKLDKMGKADVTHSTKCPAPKDYEATPIKPTTPVTAPSSDMSAEMKDQVKLAEGLASKYGYTVVSSPSGIAIKNSNKKIVVRLGAVKSKGQTFASVTSSFADDENVRNMIGDWVNSNGASVDTKDFSAKMVKILSLPNAERINVDTTVSNGVEVNLFGNAHSEYTINVELTLK